jgi:hypothetical protein
MGWHKLEELKFEASLQYADSTVLAAALRKIADEIENGKSGKQVSQDGLSGHWCCYDPYEEELAAMGITAPAE